MSKLLELLERAGRGTPTALGFTAAAHRVAPPPLVLVARLRQPPGQRAGPALVQARLDALILPAGGPGTGNPGHLSGPVPELPWGVEVEALERERLEACRASGADFVVFSLEDTQADALEEGEMARVLRLSQLPGEPTLRSLEDLPVDVVLLGGAGQAGPLTLAHLVAISNVRAATSRYLLLEWTPDLTTRELEHLRDLGVDGIVVNLEAGDGGKLATLRTRIDSLPRRRPKSDQRPAALLPRAGGLSLQRPRREEEEGEEEEEEEGP